MLTFPVYSACDSPGGTLHLCVRWQLRHCHGLCREVQPQAGRETVPTCYNRYAEFPCCFFNLVCKLLWMSGESSLQSNPYSRTFAYRSAFDLFARVWQLPQVAAASPCTITERNPMLELEHLKPSGIWVIGLLFERRYCFDDVEMWPGKGQEKQRPFARALFLATSAKQHVLSLGQPSS